MGSDFTLSKTTARAFRVGARLTGTTRKVFTWRAGLAWEHVAGGKVESRVNGLSLDVPAPALPNSRCPSNLRRSQTGPLRWASRAMPATVRAPRGT